MHNVQVNDADLHTHIAKVLDAFSTHITRKYLFEVIDKDLIAAMQRDVDREWQVPGTKVVLTQAEDLQVVFNLLPA